MTTERRAERSLTSLALHIVAYFTHTYSSNNLQGENTDRTAGYLIAWAMAALESEGGQRFTYMKNNLINAFGDNWTEKLHDKVDEMLNKFGWEAYIQSLYAK